jgi:1-acyl-sn-glycerol-3-phosphate acyltransferase
MIILGIIRGLLVAITTSFYILLLSLKNLIFGHQLDFALKSRILYIRAIIFILGIKIEKHGSVSKGTHIYISNHRSWVDPLIVLNEVPVMPVAKSEVSGWPLIGYGAKISGILYVVRESKNSRSDTVKAMGKFLKKGFSILIYPEGTTHTDRKTMPFKKGAFGLAAKENIPILPLAIEFEDEEVAWVGDDTFVPHFLKIFSKWRNQVVIHYGTPIQSNNIDILIEKTQTWIDEQLKIIHEKQSI